MRFIDSHLHVTREDSGTLVALAMATSTHLLTCGVDHETSSMGVALASEYPESVKAFVGIHPSEVEKEQTLDWFPELLERATGVGEVGLDPKYPGAGPGGAQDRAFRTQLEGAERSGKPIQVHSRGAERLCLEVISEYRVKPVLMHWFQSEESLPLVLERGHAVSFGPALVYSKRLQRLAERCEPSQVLVESDSPVSYAPLGGVHGPSLIPSVVFKLAELWGMSFEEVRLAVALNARRYLGLGEKG